MGKRRKDSPGKGAIRTGGSAADRLAELERVTNPSALTGVVRPDPLRELSLLLGVQVLDVQQDRPGEWYVEFADQPGRVYRFKSHTIRSPERLALCLLQKEPLTQAQCRRALRLMHEHLEARSGGNE